MELVQQPHISEEIMEYAYEAYVESCFQLYSERRYTQSQHSIYGIMFSTKLHDIPSFEDVHDQLTNILYYIFKDEIYEDALRNGWWKQFATEIERFSEEFYEGWYGTVDQKVDTCIDSCDVDRGLRRYLMQHQIVFEEDDVIINPPMKGVW